MLGYDVIQEVNKLMEEAQWLAQRGYYDTANQPMARAKNLLESFLKNPRVDKALFEDEKS